MICCPIIAIKYNIKVGGAKKLGPNLGNKSKYFPHYKTLQLYLWLRTRLVGIYWILQFKQRNTLILTLIKKADSSFNKDSLN